MKTASAQLAPYRGVLAFLVYAVFAIAAGSVLAWLLDGHVPVEYGKLLSRGVLLFAALGMIPLWRSLDLSAQIIDLKPVRMQQVALAAGWAVIMVLPLVLFFLVVGFRVWDPRVEFTLLLVLSSLARSLLSGVLVGLFEETLFRGLFFTVLRRRFGQVRYGFFAAALITSCAYAAAHFLRQDIQVDEAQWYGGFIHIWGAFAGLQHPAEYWDSFLPLMLLGILLCMVRERIGLWACIGLHASWVCVIRTFKDLTVRDIVNPYAHLAGTYDSFTGPLAALWLLFIFVAWSLQRHHLAARADAK